MSTILTAHNFYLRKHEMAFFSFIYYTVLRCYHFSSWPARYKVGKFNTKLEVLQGVQDKKYKT